ncbi:Transient receptor potential cation channel subfamily M member 2 [Lamellibrachia satsuma]|nr:Transient receptor potential cation channel subfamily M member 2 [Lamellibrachia satsuma]
MDECQLPPSCNAACTASSPDTGSRTHPLKTRQTENNEEQSRNVLQYVLYKLKKKWSSVDSCVTVTCESNNQLLLLFLWAIIKRQLDLAKLFWTEIEEEGIAAALLAKNLLKAMNAKTYDSAEREKLSKLMDYFDDLAVGVLNKCYDKDTNKARQLLTRKLSNFGGKTTLELAVEAHSMKFVEHAACQTLLDSIWKGKMALDTGLKTVVFSMLLPFLIPLCISFRRDAWKKNNPIRKGTHVDGGTKSQPSGDDPVTGDGTCGQKYCAFFRAPIIVFIANSVCYTGFLVLFSLILLTDVLTDYAVAVPILCGWVGTLVVEELRQAYNGGDYWTNYWNILDWVAPILFLPGIVLRFMNRDAAQIILAIDMMLFYLRTLHMFSFNRTLGPILVMIWSMMKDMSHILVILMVFVIAYGAALQAILYPNSTLGWPLLGAIFKKAFFQIDGEHFLDELDGSMECGATNSALPRCPENTAFVPIMLQAVYILFTSILMLNLLIAKFSYTFQKIHENSNQVWCFQCYGAIKEYHDRPLVVPPLNILYHIFQIISCCMKTNTNEENTNPFRE